jgi:hypothetical protein
VRFVADLFLMRCTTTFHLTPLMVPSLRGSALSMLSIHALVCTLSFSLTIRRCVFCHFGVANQRSARRVRTREVQRWAAADRHCCLLLDAGLSLLLCRKGIRATTQAPPLVLSHSLTHSVPYDSERRAAKRHSETTGLPTLTKDDTEINYFLRLWPYALTIS